MAMIPLNPGWHTWQNVVLILMQADEDQLAWAGSRDEAVEASVSLIAGLQGWLLAAGEGRLEAYAGKAACAHSAGVTASAPALSAPDVAQGSVNSIFRRTAAYLTKLLGQPPWLKQASCVDKLNGTKNQPPGP